jgi:hypothetical protein
MALIDGSMLDEIFGPSMPFSRDANERFLLDVDGATLVISSGVLQVGLIDTVNLAPGSVDGTKLNIDSGDVPHSSPSVAASDVHGALEEVALGYIDRLELAGGTMAGDIDMAGNEITGLAPATDPTDALSLASGQILVREGYFNRPPVGYAGTAVANGALRLTWIRATGSIYLTGLPTPGDTLDINGVTLTFSVSAGPNLIQIGGDVPTTVANAVSEINANTSITLDAIPLNTNVFAIQDAGASTALHLVVLNEDPPNTPEDGNGKPLSAVSAVITIRGFEGGLGTVEDGMMVPDLLTNGLYTYDLMQPATPWVGITGGGGPPSPHAASHEDAGSDEINVTGLSGLLADPQTPLSHASSHENGGADEINVGGLSGLLADPQNAGWFQSNPVSGAAPGVGQVLTWSGVVWAPTTPTTGADYDTLVGLTGPGLVVNDVVYISASNTVAKADASTAATGPARGVVVAAAAGIVDVRLAGRVTTFVGLTPGTVYYVSTAPGALMSTPPVGVGEYVQPVGIALTATTLIVGIQAMSVNT